MEYLAIKNWDDYQHYKTRNPPWIKAYASMLDDYDIGGLPDACKAHLFLIMLLASRCENRIPYDANWIKFSIQATDDIDIERILETGILVKKQRRKKKKVLAQRKHDASSVLAKGLHQKRREEAEEEKIREEKKREERESFFSNEEAYKGAEL